MPVRRHAVDRHLALGGDAHDGGPATGGLRISRRGYGGNRPVPEYAGDSTDVVDVVVADDQQGYPPHAEPVQATVDRGGIGTGIDDNRLVPADGQDNGVTLPNGAGDDQPAWWRP